MNIFSVIPESFHSKTLYQKVAKEWEGMAFSYLFLLIIILSLPLYIKLVFLLQDFKKTTVNPYINKVITQIPKMKVSKLGQVSIDKPTPYYISDPQGRPLIVIDTSGKFKYLSDTEALCLITKDKIFITKDKKEVGTDVTMIDLAKSPPNEDFYLDKEKAIIWKDSFIKWFKPILYFVLYPLLFVFLVLFTFVIRIIQALFHSLITMVVANSLKVKLEYAALLRLSTVSLTPALIIGLLLDMGNYNTGPIRLALFLLTMGFLYFAMKGNEEAT